MLTKEGFIEKVRAWARHEYVERPGVQRHADDVRSFDPVFAQMLEAREAAYKKATLEIIAYAKSKTEGR